MATARELAAGLAKAARRAAPSSCSASEGGEEKLAPLDQVEGRAADLVGVAEVWRGPEASLAKFAEFHEPVRERWEKRRQHEKFDVGELNHRQEARPPRGAQGRDGARAGPQIGRLGGRGRSASSTTAKADFEKVQGGRRAGIRPAHRRDPGDQPRKLALPPADGRRRASGAIAGQTVFEPLDNIVRAYPANHLGFFGKLGVYLGRWHEFLTDEPREANSEGGVFPAIFGTVAMTLIMSLLVVPFGVLAALYLREYAKPGILVTVVRIAVNNLAGVPSIVFGVFGLGFFCYVMGGSIDDLFFAATLPNPTFGKGGLMWASLTLALLTLPVVIVATEEAVAAVPKSMREGSSPAALRNGRPSSGSCCRAPCPASSPAWCWRSPAAPARWPR